MSSPAPNMTLPWFDADVGGSTVPLPSVRQVERLPPDGLTQRVIVLGAGLSVWTGWMQGALDSARRVVREINH